MKTLRILTTVNATLLILIACALLAAEPAKPDTDRIQGTWKVVNLEADGQAAPAEIIAAMKLTFKGDTLTFTPGEPGFTHYTYKLDPATQPPSLGMTHADGPHKGETEKGIYSLEADHLKICVGTAMNRPKDFIPISGQGLYTLERERP